MQPLLLSVENFKSIHKLSIPLHRYTVLIGPPAGGKSNILEALATIGYLVRVLAEEPAGKYPAYAGALNDYVRLKSCHDLINKHHAKISRGGPVRIQLSDPSKPGNRLEAEIECQDVIRTVARAGGVSIAVDLKTRDYQRWETPQLPRSIERDEIDEFLIFMEFFKSFLESIGTKRLHAYYEIREKKKEGELPEALPHPRLYAFDRFGILRKIVHGLTGHRGPPYLHEQAWNLGTLLYDEPSITDIINEVIAVISGLELRPLANGMLAFFDGKRDVGASSVSDTILRIVYFLSAIASARRVSIEKKQTRVSLEPLVLIEEPEAHMYPIAFGLFVNVIETMLPEGSRLVLSTHSPELASLLYDKLDDVAIYYVYRDYRTNDTDVLAVDVNRLLEEGELIHTLMEQHPTQEAIEEYVELGVLRPTGINASVPGR